MSMDRVTADLREHERGQDEADRAYAMYGEEAKAAYVARKLADPRWVRQCVVDGEWMDALAEMAHAVANRDFIRAAAVAETLRREMISTAQQYSEADSDGEVAAAVWSLYRQGDE